MDADKTVTATFTQDEYTLNVTLVGQGASSGSRPADLPLRRQGRLTPTADAGWKFTGWSGDLTGSDDPETVTINGDTAVTATFEEYAAPLGRRRLVQRYRRRRR